MWDAFIRGQESLGLTEKLVTDFPRQSMWQERSIWNSQYTPSYSFLEGNPVQLGKTVNEPHHNCEGTAFWMGVRVRLASVNVELIKQRYSLISSFLICCCNYYHHYFYSNTVKIDLLFITPKNGTQEIRLLKYLCRLTSSWSINLKVSDNNSNRGGLCPSSFSSTFVSGFQYYILIKIIKNHLPESTLWYVSFNLMEING